MWKKILWADHKPGMYVYDCCSTDKAEEEEALAHVNRLGKPAETAWKGPNHCALEGEEGEHKYCIAWVEEVTLPRVVVEWSDEGKAWRLIETAPGKLTQEYKRKATDSLGTTTESWELYGDTYSQLVKSLVALIPNVG